MSRSLRHLPTLSNIRQASFACLRRRATKVQNYFDATRDEEPIQHSLTRASSLETLQSSASNVQNHPETDEEPNNSIVRTPPQFYASVGSHSSTDEDEDEDEEPSNYSITRTPPQYYAPIGHDPIDENAELQAELTAALKEIRAMRRERHRMEEAAAKPGWRTADEIMLLEDQAEAARAEPTKAVEVLERCICLLATSVWENRVDCVKLVGLATGEALIAVVVFTILHFLLAIFGLPTLTIVYLVTGTWYGESLALMPHWSILVGAALCFSVCGALSWLKRKLH